ncbi:hypothetical protein T484DRAFT_1923942 [Baffinella frigidus]|nr:hypothetical protein T484DRAFT_1923942 [Cryptophyta sp. CCMP2293]
MLHWDVLRVDDRGGHGDARNDRRHEFYERLLDATQGAAEWCDASSGRGRSLLSSLALLVSFIEAYAGSSLGSSNITSGLARGLGACRDLLYRRMLEAEAARVRVMAGRLLRGVVRAVADNVDVGAVAKDGETAMAGLLERIADRRVVPWLQRGAVQWCVAVLDAGLLDEMLDEVRLCSFEAALAVKSLVAAMERVLQRGRVGEMRWTEAESDKLVSLSLARQACDLVMMDKTKLVGPDAQEWRTHMCPSLSARRISALVQAFVRSGPSPEGPQALTEILHSLEQHATQARPAQPLKAGPEVDQLLLELPAPLPQPFHQDLAARGASAVGLPSSYPLLAARRTMAFLWH